MNVGGSVMKKVFSVLISLVFILLFTIPASAYSCVQCRDTGVCSMCNGVGNSDCTVCKGSGINVCTVCHGAGGGACSNKRCEDGFVRCSYCDGKSYKMQTCTHCNKTGLEICSNCKGKGCYKCNHKGFKLCSTCEGAGSFVCASCNGKGATRCGFCFGNGYRTCTSCAGTGICRFCHGKSVTDATLPNSVPQTTLPNTSSQTTSSAISSNITLPAGAYDVVYDEYGRVISYSVGSKHVVNQVGTYTKTDSEDNKINAEIQPVEAAEEGTTAQALSNQYKTFTTNETLYVVLLVAGIVCGLATIILTICLIVFKKKGKSILPIGIAMICCLVASIAFIVSSTLITRLILSYKDDSITVNIVRVYVKDSNMIGADIEMVNGYNHPVKNIVLSNVTLTDESGNVYAKADILKYDTLTFDGYMDHKDCSLYAIPVDENVTIPMKTYVNYEYSYE